jgi:hypothetical protein
MSKKFGQYWNFKNLKVKFIIYFGKGRPTVLEINKNSTVFNQFPLVLSRSLSEDCDPFESVKRNLSNGTLDRCKIFERIKVSRDITIGGKKGSTFHPFIRNNISDRTASSSYDSTNNEDENERKCIDSA